jgi:predicted ATPase
MLVSASSSSRVYIAAPPFTGTELAEAIEVKITELQITNYKALKSLCITNAADLIVLAGPNGCGKSCVLDAIRLLKSAYGGYIANESQSWLGEFQIAHRPGYIDPIPLLNDRTKNLKIRAKFKLSPTELSFLRGDITELVRDMAVNESADAPFLSFRSFHTLASQARVSEPAIREASEKIRKAIESDLLVEAIEAELSILPNGSYELRQSRLLELIFSTFKPGQVGVIDFQNANRSYKREATGSVHVTIDQTVDQTSAKARNHSLYNHEQRYSDLKHQLASAYVKGLIGAQAPGGQRSTIANDLTATLKDLFATFIPGKNFEGPTPSQSGTLQFNVTTSAGAVHDINDLSSGEKEVLYGYLLLSNRAPKNSILMIDEPELHLNPRLVVDLPSFYAKHLGKPLGNQIWLVTHSDAIVRGAVATPGAMVLHLQPATNDSQTNQSTPVVGETEMQSLVLSLVGDLAAYRPTAPILLVEGGGDSDDASNFDANVISRLFPEFAKKVNIVSGHSKRRVVEINQSLRAAHENGLVSQQSYCLVDQDDNDEDVVTDATIGQFVWDRYHIENYLLDARFILEALRELNPEKCVVASEADVDTELKRCASDVVPKVVSHRLINSVRNSIVRSVKIGCDPGATDLAKSLSTSIDSTHTRLSRLWESELSQDALRRETQKIELDASAALDSNQWNERLPGREILKAFAARHVSTAGRGAGGYIAFRNIVLARMVSAGHRPEGMSKTLKRISTAAEAALVAKSNSSANGS